MSHNSKLLAIVEYFKHFLLNFYIKSASLKSLTTYIGSWFINWYKKFEFSLGLQDLEIFYIIFRLIIIKIKLKTSNKNMAL